MTGKLAFDPRAAPRNLVVVSNRTPPADDREHATLEGALASALRAHDGIWIGWDGVTEPKPAPLSIDTAAQPVRASFGMTREWREQFHAGFCNSALWPLFHGFRGCVRYTDADWNAYVRANDAYARHALGVTSLDGIVWVHDYHLLLTAQALRRLGHRGPIGLFLHIPFPARDLLETLPWSSELREAMLEFDLIGFQTERWAENFVSSVSGMRRVSCEPGLVRHGDHKTSIRVLPVPIHAAAFANPTDDAADVAGLRNDLGDRRLLLAVDSLDVAKGIPERLHAFERMLSRSREWHGKIVMLQIATPSRIEPHDDVELRNRIELLVGRINGQYGEADWVPVRYVQRSFEPRVLAQLYRMAHVGLVTPLRDGMNLVAKEFVAAQDPERPGVLVLSHYAGAAEHLTSAVLTNPFHPEGLATDIDLALRMSPEERLRRHHQLAAAVTAGGTPEQWAAQFVHLIARATRARATDP